MRVRVMRLGDVRELEQRPVPAATAATEMPLQSGPSFWRAVAFSVIVSVTTGVVMRAFFDRR
jgi:hypothetical protein